MGVNLALINNKNMNNAEIGVSKEQFEDNKEKGEETDSESDVIEKEIEDKAIEESRAYFEAKNKKIFDFIKDKEEDITGIIRTVKEGADATEDVVGGILQGDEDEIGIGFFKIVTETINACKPIGELDSAFQVFDNMMRDKYSVAKQVQEAREDYRRGEGWYHTTRDGRDRLSFIKSGIKEK